MFFEIIFEQSYKNIGIEKFIEPDILCEFSSYFNLYTGYILLSEIITIESMFFLMKNIPDFVIDSYEMPFIFRVTLLSNIPSFDFSISSKKYRSFLIDVMKGSNNNIYIFEYIYTDIKTPYRASFREFWFKICIDKLFDALCTKNSKGWRIYTKIVLGTDSFISSVLSYVISEKWYILAYKFNLVFISLYLVFYNGIFSKFGIVWIFKV